MNDAHEQSCAEMLEEGDRMMEHDDLRRAARALAVCVRDYRLAYDRRYADHEEVA